MYSSDKKINNFLDELVHKNKSLDVKNYNLHGIEILAVFNESEVILRILNGEKIVCYKKDYEYFLKIFIFSVLRSENQ